MRHQNLQDRRLSLSGQDTDLPELSCPVRTRVVDSRDDDTSVRRRRECLDCRHRFTTYERIEVPRLFVVKKDGRREQFSREKLLNGLRRACEKRPISDVQLQDLVASIERTLFVRGESEIPASVVGEKLMEALKGLDKVAYIRFASVYRSFHDVESFQAELAALQNK